MNTRKMIAVCLTLVLALGLPLTVLAEEYDLANGSIEVMAKDDGQYVSQTNGVANEKQTTATVITQTGGSTENTVTIKAEEKQTANVTLSGVNIDTSKNGGAAVTTGGKGNVTIELDGSNTVKSGNFHAGVEKKNEGNLTIADENKNGSLNATGGENGAGIGGGGVGDGTDITVSGGEVTAKGGKYGAGIGGGYLASGTKITVFDGKVNATGGEHGAGIGGGGGGDGTDITVSGGEVTAKGGEGGAGIGGGAVGIGSEIAVTGDAQVTVQGGKEGILAGTGAGIGSGSNWEQNGEELSMDPDKLNEGTIRYYAPGANMQTDAPTKILYNTKGEHNWDGGKVTTPATCTGPGVRTYTCQTHSVHTKTEDIPALAHKFETYIYNNDATCDADGTETAQCSYNCGHTDTRTKAGTRLTHLFETYVYNNDATYEADGTETALCAHPGCGVTDTRRAPGTRLYWPVLYRVTDGSGKDISCQTEQTGSVLTITVKDAEFAIFTGSLRGIGILKQQGIETIRFVTKDAVSTFRLDKLLQQGGNSDTYTLTHDGKTVTFTCKDRDIQKILEG